MKICFPRRTRPVAERHARAHGDPMRAVCLTNVLVAPRVRHRGGLEPFRTTILEREESDMLFTNHTRLNALLRNTALLVGLLAWAAIGALAFAERRGSAPSDPGELDTCRLSHSAAAE